MASYWDSIIDNVAKYAPSVISLIGSANAGKNASGAAKYASGQTEALRTQELGVRQQQLDLAKNADARSGQLFDTFSNDFLPAQRLGLAANTQALGLAAKPVDPNVEAGLAAGDYAAADTAAIGANNRRMQAAGIAPNSGAALEANRLTGLSSVTGKAGAATTARRSAVNTQIARLGAAAQPLATAGNGLLSGAGAFGNSANAAAASAGAGLSSLAGDYASDASKAGQVAGAAGQATGATTADLLTQILNQYRESTLQPITPSVKPITIPRPVGSTPNAAGGEAATSYGLDNAPAGAPLTTGRDMSGVLGGLANIPSGLQNLDYGKMWSGMSDADLAKALGTDPRVFDPNTFKTPGLSSVGSGIGGVLGIAGGIKEGGVKGIGSAVAGASQLAGALGVGGTGTGVAGTVGNLVAGNYAGAAQGAASLAGGTGSAIGSTIAASGLSTAMPMAAIGFAVANALNKSGDLKSAGTSSLIAELQKSQGWTQVNPKNGTYKMPDGRFIQVGDKARAVSEAMRTGNQAAYEAAWTEWINSASTDYKTAVKGGS